MSEPKTAKHQTDDTTTIGIQETRYNQHGDLLAVVNASFPINLTKQYICIVGQSQYLCLHSTKITCQWKKL